jgi:sigma-B regulation protein RsbU (phosphoserine phosphatase)
VLAKPFDREELRVRLRAGERIVRLEQDLAHRNRELQNANRLISAANRRMKRDLDAAAKIQQALLPTTRPDCKGAIFAWVFKPCEELAGDNLGIIELDHERVALFVLDVSGHGLAAALLSVTVRHFLSPLPSKASLLRRAQAGIDDRVVPPAEVAEELNRRFPMDFAIGQFFTLLYGILDLCRREFRFISAGHVGPIHVPRQGPPALLSSPGFPIGVTEEPKFEERAVTLAPGDRLYLYSDGIVEAMNSNFEQFGPARLLETLAQCQSLSLQDGLQLLVGKVEQWFGQGQVRDDISVVAVEITDGERSGLPAVSR